MRVSLRFCVLFLVTVLFVLSLAFVPGETSARKPEDKKDRSVGTKPESGSREGRTETEPARERDNRPTPIGAQQPPAHEKPGVLKRIGNLFKDLLFTGKRREAEAADADDDQADDPDRPPGFVGPFDESEYLQRREAFIALLRGVDPSRPSDPAARVRANEMMDQQMSALQSAIEKSKGTSRPLAFPNWLELGPNPIPLGQTSTTRVNVSGRISAIEIDPTDPNKVYVGAAQGGVYRSLDGGTTWAPIFDTAQTLAIGSLNLDPVNGWLWVGTGEANGSGDSFAGVGLYRIENVNTTATLVGPINPVRNYNNASGNPVSTGFFTGRSISKILRVPGDPNTLFVGIAGGVIGLGGNPPFGNTLPPLAMRGMVRLSNVTGPPAGITGKRLAVSTVDTGQGLCAFDLPCTVNRNVNDMVLDPQDPSGNTLIVWLNGINVANDGGIYRSTNAMGASPTFTQTLVTTSTSTSNGRGELRAYVRSGVTEIYVASGEPSNVPSGATICNSSTQFGALRRSDNGGVTWSAKLAGGGGFCQGQCFYNIGFDVVPGAATTTDKLLLGGNVASGSCARQQATSLDGGATTFTSHDATTHPDTHVVKVAASDPNTVYRGDDGGVWKSIDGGNTWVNQNNTTLRATQFQSIAVHPTDPDISIGGTQDNGTEELSTGPTWLHSDDGDGGFAMIDQSTPTTMYHTYFNQAGSQIGYSRSLTGGTFGSWSFLGCSGVGTTNGVSCAATVAVNFYCPTALGPGSPNNTVYLGTDRLLRSSTQGTANVAVSQVPIQSGVPISAIGISQLDDNYRIVGLNNGAIWYTTTGSSTLTSLDAVGAGSVIPDFYVGRLVFDPANKNTVYIALGNYSGGTSTSQSHVWKVTNLNTTPVITGVNGSGITGLPDVPVNGFAIDPQKPARLFAGTDIGVFISENAGAAWSPYGQGLPRVAVFDMAIQNVKRVLRIATHGRGMWEIPLLTPTAANGSIGGTITDANGAPVSGVTINLSGTESREAITDSSGRYSFDSVETNGFYTVTPSRANYTFSPANRSFSLLGVRTEASFTANANGDRANAIDTIEFFVRQHYLDFLGREPDPPGFIGWVNTLRNCAAGDASCDRVHVSESFYRAQEFQDRGYFAYRFYSTALGRKPDYAEFAPDLARVSGFLTNDQLETAKTAFIDDFIMRPAFAAQYNRLSNSAYVDALLNTAGVNLSNRQALVDSLNRGTATRAQVLRQIAESGEVYQRYYNQAFVVMEYFGYLHRDPDALYLDWVRALDANPADSRRMVDGFVNSTEYRNRFAQ